MSIRNEIINDPENAKFTNEGIFPLFSYSEKSKIIIIGQAPGSSTHKHNVPWMDKSGEVLIDWLGVNSSDFYDGDIFAFLPMDFYYPGKGKSGDLPPRKNFAKKWHPKILEKITSAELIILVGSFSQDHYLADGKNITSRLKEISKYSNGKYFPLVHPSARNNIWLKKNPFFKEKILPLIKDKVKKIIK